MVSLLVASRLHNFGWLFFSFNAAADGIMVYVTGSFLTAVPALVLAMLVGLGIAVASTTYLPRLVSAWLDPFVDVLAGIPSIVYGIWGFYVVGPYLGATVFPWTAEHVGFLPGLGATAFSPAASGQGLALAIVILFLMILPITTLLVRDALRAIPRDLWESGLALGATRWEVVRRVALPYAKRGVWAAGFLGFGRAIGETVGVAMVIGQAAKLPGNAYDGTSTMASLIINTVDSAFELGNTIYLQFLAELGIVLFAITLVVNLAGRLYLRRTYTEVAGL